MTKRKSKAAPDPKSTKKPKEEPAAFRPFAAPSIQALRDALTTKDAEGATRPKEPRPRKSQPPPKPATEDEALALYRMMNGVTPLKPKSATRLPRLQSEAPRGQIEARRAEIEAPVRAEDDAVHAHLRALVEGGRFEVEDDGRRVEGRRHGVTPDIARKLRRGMFPIDGRLDLHGVSAANAPRVLEKFLAEQRARGERCVLVIHGKGSHSPGQVGILRGEMAAWLSQGSPSASVAAFATASDADGGEGATYVLLLR
jgi:DNA-nicking Smr family endonuclease